MTNKKKLFSLVALILVSIFIGYENPEIVEIPKNKIKNLFSNSEKKQVRPNNEDENKNKVEILKEEFFANSFSLEIEKIKPIDFKTAGLFFEGKNLKIFSQKGEIIHNKNNKKINLPQDFTIEKEGGVRNIIYFQKNFYALISRKNKNCYYSSLINIKDQSKVFDTKCLPIEEDINFAGIGGAFTFKDNNLLISVGTPTHQSDIIDMFAQNNNYLYGKILLLEKESDSDKKYKIKIFSSGHRNPQGLTSVEDILFSTEHGPQGGDELNIVEMNKNFGWPIVSLGTRYGGKSFDYKKNDKFTNPIFSFLPSIAPSMMSNCPHNLKDYYGDYICLIGLSLREMSLIIYLVDRNTKNLISYEKIFLEKRLRHLALDKEAKLFTKPDSSFYFSSDKDGIYKGLFKDFR